MVVLGWQVVVVGVGVDGDQYFVVLVEVLQYMDVFGVVYVVFDNVDIVVGSDYFDVGEW